MLDIVTITDVGPSEPPDWLWTGYLARGAITLLTGLWKAGKSTLLAHLLRDLRRGSGLVDGPADCGVLILTEESRSIWATRRDDLSLGPETRLATKRTLGRPTRRDWSALIGEVVEEIADRDIGFVVIDTLPSWWCVLNENDAGETMDALSPLRAITDAGAALLIAQHPRKGDGTQGTATRGSGALPGFVDIIVELRRYSDSGPPDSRRVLKAYGRYDQIPDERVIELTDDGYVVIGEVADARSDDIRETIYGLLPDEGEGLTFEEVRDRWADPPAPGNTRLRGFLNEGANLGRWDRSGTGRKGSPHRFRRIAGEPDSFRSPKALE